MKLPLEELGLSFRLLRASIVELSFFAAILAYTGGMFPIRLADFPEMATGFFPGTNSGFYQVYWNRFLIIHTSPKRRLLFGKKNKMLVISQLLLKALEE